MHTKLKVYEHSDQVLAVFFISIMLLRIIYSKTRRLNNAAMDKEILNKVGYKVEDLELKVNILTYKMQYGTWPLPHQIHKSGFTKNLRKLRLTLSNQNDRNDWIKQVLLSPAQNVSYLKCNHPSTHRLTELFDAKKKRLHPYFHRDVIPMEHSSTKSTKSSSDKCLKISSTCTGTTNRKERKATKSENLEMQHRNPAPLPVLPRKRSTRSTSKIFRDQHVLLTQKMSRSCEKFTKSMDDCKWFLKELHESNKSLGIVCSSSEISDQWSVKDIWLKPQQTSQAEENERFERNPDSGEIMGDANANKEMKPKGTDIDQHHTEDCLNLTNAMSPVSKLIDQRLLPQKLNVTFCTEMLPRQPLTDIIGPPTFKLNEIVHTSEETLYQVKRNLESLHNVLKAYETDHPDIYRNIGDAIVSIKAEIENLNEKKKSKVTFDTDTKMNTCDSPEQYESDDTRKTSEISLRSCSNGKFYFSSINQGELNVCNGVMRNITIENPFNSVKYERIPERVYYTLSTDSFEEECGEKKIITSFGPRHDNKDNQLKSLILYDQRPTPMDTEEDVMILSPVSSHSEISKGSELDDESTALLLEQALRFKKALMTRIERENPSFVDDPKTEDSKSESTSEHNLNDDLQPKLLDIITEEQSVSSSTEKTDRTYLFSNKKQEENSVAQYSEIQNSAAGSRIEPSDIQNQNTESKEYFSFNDGNREENGIDNNELYLSNEIQFHENMSSEILTSNLQIKYINAKAEESTSSKNLVESKPDVQRNTNMEFKRFYETEQLPRIKNINELITRNVESIREYIESFSRNRHELILNSQETNQGKTLPDKMIQDETLVNTKVTPTNNPKYNEDNEILKFHPNLTLKRNPGMCSLIAQTLSSTNIEGESRICISDPPSPSESKDYTIQINAMDDSLLPAGNHSNHFHDLQPLSITELTDTMINEKEVNPTWQHIENDFNDTCVNREQNCVSISPNTLAIHKSGMTIKQEQVNDNDTTSMEERIKVGVSHDRKDKLEETKPTSSSEICFTEQGKGDTANETELSKSYLNLFSPHSSLYFTDEASSSIVKLNKTQSDVLEGYPNSNFVPRKSNFNVFYDKAQLVIEYPRQYMRSNESGDNTMPDKHKQIKSIVTSATTEKTTHVENSDTPLSNSSNRNKKDERLPSIHYTENKRVLPIKETQRNSIRENQDEFQSISNNLNLQNTVVSRATTSNSDSNSHKPIENSLMNKTEPQSGGQDTLYPSIPDQEVSPWTGPDDTVVRKACTPKSKSQENYTTKSERIKKPTTGQNIKDVRANVSHVAQQKAQSNFNLSSAKVKELSAESRRSAVHNNNKVHKKRSRSQISFRTTKFSSHDNSLPSESTSSLTAANREPSIDNKCRQKTRSKSLIPILKPSSKSCIPILKNRLGGTRLVDNETRPKSPMRGPLTVTMLWRDNLCKNPNVGEDMIQTEGTPKSAEQRIRGINDPTEKSNETQKCDNTQSLMKSYDVPGSADERNLNSNVIPQERMVIYVNVFTKYDQNTTRIMDPNKFLQYIKNRELNISNVFDKNKLSMKDTYGHTESHIAREKEESTIRNVVTIVSTSINGNDLEQNYWDNPSASENKSVSSANTLPSDKLKNLCFLSVEQREIDVTAKPSVADTSTSISDLQNISTTSKTAISRFQICGTPKELNNEEYITLLEILHQEPNIVHLQELQALCKKLVSEYRTSD